MSMRVLGGELKGREVLTPRGGETVRPMTGLVRKSVFDILAGRLEGAVVADLYSGTGTIGIEALSRGAARCYFAERDRRVADLLRRNIRELALRDRAVVWEGDLTSRLAGWLEEARARLDVAFVDPPFPDTRRWDWGEAVPRIFGPLWRHLAEDGVVVLRLPAGAECPAELGPLVVRRRKEYGDMFVVFLGLRQRPTADDGPENPENTARLCSPRADCTDSGNAQTGDRPRGMKQNQTTSRDGADLPDAPVVGRAPRALGARSLSLLPLSIVLPPSCESA